MATMKPKDLLKLLEDNGWYVSRVNGSHHIMKHNEKSGRIVVPIHGKDMNPKTLNNILKDAGLK